MEWVIPLRFLGLLEHLRWQKSNNLGWQHRKKDKQNDQQELKINPANREKRNLEHQHPAIECSSAVWTSWRIEKKYIYLLSGIIIDEIFAITRKICWLPLEILSKIKLQLAICKLCIQNSANKGASGAEGFGNWKSCKSVTGMFWQSWFWSKTRKRWKVNQNVFDAFSCFPKYQFQIFNTKTISVAILFKSCEWR